jgi:hypothetical protein
MCLGVNCKLLCLRKGLDNWVSSSQEVTMILTQQQEP